MNIIHWHVHKPDISPLYEKVSQIDAYVKEADLLSDINLATNEIISNASRHSIGQEIEMKINIDEDGVEVEVYDYGNGFVPPPILTKRDAQDKLDSMGLNESGRGLLICMICADRITILEGLVQLLFRWRTILV